MSDQQGARDPIAAEVEPGLGLLIAGRRIHYAWIVAAVTFLVMVAAAGIRSVPGVLILPLEEQFGWSRATLSLAVSINLLLYGVCGPFASAIMDRIGTRRIMSFSFILVGSAVALTSLMTQVWQLYLLWGLAVGLGTGAMAGWLAPTIANRWFVKDRGLVVGILTAAGATGQLIFLPILAVLAVNVGWQASVLFVAVIAALIVPLIVFLMRDFPQDVGQRPLGATATDTYPSRRVVTGNPFASAVNTLSRVSRSKDFWLLAGSFFICGATTNGLIGTHLIPASVEHGLSEVTAASFLAVIGIFDLIGATVSGWLSDRYDNRWLLVWYYSLRGLSLMFLPYAYDTGIYGLAIFVIFYGLDWVATVPPTVRLTADIFGKQNVGTVFAWISASHQLGAAFAAMGAGALRTWLGDYQAGFMAAGVLALIAAGMVMRIDRTTRPEILIRPILTSAPASGGGN